MNWNLEFSLERWISGINLELKRKLSTLGETKELISSRRVALHKVIYVRSLKGQMVLVEVLEKCIHAITHLVKKCFHFLSIHSKEWRKLLKDCKGLGCYSFLVIPRMTEKKIKFLIGCFCIFPLLLMSPLAKKFKIFIFYLFIYFYLFLFIYFRFSFFLIFFKILFYF